MSTTIATRLRKYLRSGSINCIHCNVVFQCKQYKGHIFDKHPDKKSLCSFCGTFTLVLNEKGVCSEETLKHIHKCSAEAKKLYRSLHKGTIKRKFYGSFSRDGEITRTIQYRNHVMSGKFAEDVNASNEKSIHYDAVSKFFNDESAFKLPLWVTDLCERFYDLTISNELEFHSSYNIDTIWGKLAGIKALEFYHITVHMCIFEKFCETILQLKDKCTLLRYGCMCDKFRRHHVHFILAALKDSTIQCDLRNGSFKCEITEERERLNGLLKNADIILKPCWPEHEHFGMTLINGNMHLFNTIRYVGSRNELVKRRRRENVKYRMYELVNMTTSPEHLALKDELDKFIASYMPDFDYQGRHYNILRPVTEDAPLWYSAVSRMGTYSYIRYLMNSRTLDFERCLDEVETKDDGTLVLKLHHIFNCLRHYAVPLPEGTFLYHRVCGGREVPKDECNFYSYIYLGRNEYIYLRNGNTPCCNDDDDNSKHILFLNQADSNYDLTPQQSSVYKQMLSERKKN